MELTDRELADKRFEALMQSLEAEQQQLIYQMKLRQAHKKRRTKMSGCC